MVNKELKRHADEMVATMNNMLRDKFNEMLADGKTTMAKLERAVGAGHTFMFAWRNGEMDIARMGLFLRFAKALGVKVIVKR